jgi:hypothetical protein
MASKNITKYALILNMLVDMTMVFSRKRRQASVGKVFGAGTAVGQAFFAHAMIRGMAGFNVHNLQLRKAAFYSLLIELFYVVTSGKAFKNMRPMLIVLAVMLGITGSNLKNDFKRKKRE